MKINGGLVKGMLAAAAVAALVALGVDTEAQAQATTASACKGLTETACKANTSCSWIVPKKGKQKPYCRTKTSGKTKAKSSPTTTKAK